MNKNIYDVAIVGAGAAGLMCAIHTARQGLATLLLDSRERIGAKILMSGGTRCNVTNKVVTENDFNTEDKHVLKAILKAYPPEKTRSFFEEIGIDLVLEPSGKYFPSTHSGRDVLESLVRAVSTGGTELVTGRKITQIKKEDEQFVLADGTEEFRSKTVVMTTGGLSYPATGSDGSGYSLAEAMGHRFVAASPALTPLRVEDQQWNGLSGVSLDVKLTIKQETKKIFEETGSLLFTHFGLSGPVVLDASRFWIRGTKDSPCQILLCFLPAANQDAFEKELREAGASSPKTQIRTFLSRFLPDRLVSVILEKQSIPVERKFAELQKAERQKLSAGIFRCPVPVTGNLGYEKAEVTAGGVTLKEIRKQDCQSKVVPGLFFAGEILDVDGRIGGFNFQWSWSSGFVAAQGAGRYLTSQAAGKRQP